MDLKLRGRTALVTGASRGIGLSIARTLAEEGCNLHLAATNGALLEKVAASIRSEFDVATTIHVADLSTLDGVQKVAHDCGQLDVLVNNAGAIPRGRLAEVSPAAWRKGWDLKVFGFIDLTRLVYPRMCERGSGVIVNVIGLAGERPNATSIAVATGNAALRMFTFCLGGESIKFGVRVVGVNPGAILSDRLLHGAERTAQDQFGDKRRWPELFKTLPIGHPGQPEDVARMVAFLASDLASYISGEVIRIDAGMRVHDPHE
jgi:hypothetical protein